jgi:hypothetical protein
MNTYSNHQIIPREQTYVLDRKFVTIHSNDRDIKKWPFPNHFEVTLPEAITNIDSMRVVEAKLPSNYYNFSNELQNTKMAFSLTNINANWNPTINALLTNSGILNIVIQSGFYTPQQLASELTYQLNKAVTDYLVTNGITTTTYDQFVVHHDVVAMKFIFGNRSDGFVLRFADKMNYTINQCEQPNAWERYSQWGLGSFLGFEKQNYLGTASNTELISGWNNPASKWLQFSTTPTSTTVYYTQAPLVFKLSGETTVYMELDRYNNIDELVPFSESTNSMYNNDYSGSVNSAFAKIPIKIVPYGETFDSINEQIISGAHFEPPLERVQKLKFRFRNHVGTLIDFQDFPFNFTIEFNCLRNEISKKYSTRVPNVYSF